MRLAQVLQFDQHQAIGRRRAAPAGSTGVVIQLFRSGPRRADATVRPAMPDDEGFAGRGRDPG